jgi:ferritin
MITKATQSSIKNPKTLDAASVTKLNERLKDEYAAHYFYRNAHNWCAGEGYLKAAAFFAEEAAAELGHAEGLQKFLVDWNVQPTMPSVKANINFTNLIDIVNKAYQIEYALFEAYVKDSKELFVNDLNTFDFLTGYRSIQNQSVIEYSDLLNAAMLVNVENNFEVLYFEQTYFN